MNDEAQTITIDEVDYEWDSLSEGVKHAVGQIQHCRMQVENARLEVQRCEMMEAGYTAMLKEEMQRMKDEA